MPEPIPEPQVGREGSGYHSRTILELTDPATLTFYLTLIIAVWIVGYSLTLLYWVHGLRTSTRRLARFMDRMAAFLAGLTDTEIDALFTAARRMARKQAALEATRAEYGVPEDD